MKITATPQRLQLSRSKGFDLQAQSRALNGLPAVWCVRPGRFGNPYRVRPGEDPREAVTKFRGALTCMLAGAVSVTTPELWHVHEIAVHLPELRGKNLACCCPVPAAGQPDICHAAILLQLANA